MAFFYRLCIAYCSCLVPWRDNSSLLLAAVKTVRAQLCPLLLTGRVQRFSVAGQVFVAFVPATPPGSRTHTHVLSRHKPLRAAINAGNARYLRRACALPPMTYLLRPAGRLRRSAIHSATRGGLRAPVNKPALPRLLRTRVPLRRYRHQFLHR